MVFAMSRKRSVLDEFLESRQSVQNFLSDKSLDVNDKYEDFHNKTLLHLVVEETILDSKKTGDDIYHQTLNQLLDRPKIDIKAQDGFEKTALHYAASIENGDALKKLIDKAKKTRGFNISDYINMRDSEGKTALHYAAEHGNSDIINLLLENGADPAIRDKSDKTALHIFAEKASDSHTPEVLNKLIERSITRGRMPSETDLTIFLNDVCKRGSLPLAKALIEKGAKFGQLELYEKLLLSSAIKHDSYDGIKRILAAFPPKDTEKAIKYSISTAFNKEKLGICRSLLDETDISSFRDIDGATALHMAARIADKHPEIFAAILEKIPDDKLPAILLQKTQYEKKPLEVLAERVQDPNKQKEIKEFAKHIGGILREDNPGLRTSLKKKIFDFLKTIFRNSAKTKLFDGVSGNSTPAEKIKAGLIKRMKGETSPPPSHPSSSATRRSP